MGVLYACIQTHQLRHKPCLFSALPTPVVKSVFFLLMHRPSQVCRQPHGALLLHLAPVSAARVLLMCLSGQEAFPLLCRKQLGLKRLLCGQESPSSVPGHWVCWLLCLRDEDKRGGGRLSHVLPKYSLQSLGTNVKVIGRRSDCPWVRNMAPVTASGYHRWGAKCCAKVRVCC